MKHKLNGYAIKGDGSQETADRIRKVFEADNFECTGRVGVDDDYYYADLDSSRLRGVLPVQFNQKWYSEFKVIPLTEAERIVFGGLKVGVKVVTLPDSRGYGLHGDDEGKIFEVVGFGRTIVRKHKTVELKPCDHEQVSKASPVNVLVEKVRRATITDFLRTLPSDIAARALRQVDEEWRRYNDHPESLTEAVERFCDWEGTDEKWDFWNHIYEGNYDRARAILAEKDRVGKWWKNGGICFCTRTDEDGNLYGYGVDDRGQWYDDNEEVAMHCASLSGATPATPEEVEAMLVKEAKRKYKVGDKISSVLDGQNWVIEKLRFEINLCDFEGDCVVRIDGIMVFCNGKWAEIITPAPKKAEPKYIATVPPKKSTMIEKLKEVLKNISDEDFIREWNAIGEDLNLTNSDKSPTDKFPRVMWVWDVEETEDVEDGDIERGLVHTSISGEEYSHIAKAFSCKWYQGFRYASDTHPVTGEPAVKKDVVEQIRDKAKAILSEADNGSKKVAKYNAAFMDGVEFSANEIKQILTKNEKR